MKGTVVMAINEELNEAQRRCRETAHIAMQEGDAREGVG